MLNGNNYETSAYDLLWKGLVTNDLFLVKMAISKDPSQIEAKKAVNLSINYTPLLYSSHNGYLEIVKFLVENRANIHADDDDALRLASGVGHLEVVKYLVEHGANIHAENDEALRMSSRFGHLEVVKYLVRMGAGSWRVRTYNDEALGSASSNGHLEVVKFLVKHIL